MSPVVLILVMVLLACATATYFGTRLSKLGIFFIGILIGIFGVIVSGFLLQWLENIGWLHRGSRSDTDGLEIVVVVFCIPLYWLFGYIAHAASGNARGQRSP